MGLWEKMRALVPARRDVVKPSTAPARPTAPLVPWRGRVVHRSRDFEQRHGVWSRRDVAAQLIWQADDAEKILARAESGDMRPLALFVDALRSDDTVGATMDHLCSMLRLPISWDGDPVLVQALAGRNPTFDARTGLELDPGELGDFWLMFPHAELREVFWDGRVAGLGLGEFVPQSSGPPRLRHLDLHNVRLDWNTERLYYHSMGETYEICPPADGEYPRWFVFQPYGNLRFWRKAPWRRCFDPYVQKKKARLYRLRKMGDMANALHVVIANPNRNGKELDDLALFASEYWDDDSYVILEEGEEAKIVEAQGQGWQAFDSGEDRADKALARALSGQVVTSTGPAGGNNTGGVWDNIARGIIEEQADRLADACHERGFRPYGRARGRSGAVWIKWDVRSPQQKTAEAETLGKVSESIEKADKVLEARDLRVAARAFLEVQGLAVPLETRAGKPLGPSLATPHLRAPPQPWDVPSELVAAAFAAAAPWHGLPVVVELQPGDIRAGWDPDGVPWWIEMRCGYGCLQGTVGTDGEAVDVYLGPDPSSELAVVVSQLTKAGAPDEEKLLLGWWEEEEAVAAYLRHVPTWAYGGHRVVSVNDAMTEVQAAAWAAAKWDEKDHERANDGKFTSGGGSGGGGSGGEKPSGRGDGGKRPSAGSDKMAGGGGEKPSASDKRSESAARYQPAIDKQGRAQAQRWTHEDAHDGMADAKSDRRDAEKEIKKLEKRHDRLRDELQKHPGRDDPDDVDALAIEAEIDDVKDDIGEQRRQMAEADHSFELHKEHADMLSLPPNEYREAVLDAHATSETILKQAERRVAYDAESDDAVAEHERAKREVAFWSHAAGELDDTLRVDAGDDEEERAHLELAQIGKLKGDDHYNAVIERWQKSHQEWQEAGERRSAAERAGDHAAADRAAQEQAIIGRGMKVWEDEKIDVEYRRIEDQHEAEIERVDRLVGEERRRAVLDGWARAHKAYTDTLQQQEDAEEAGDPAKAKRLGLEERQRRLLLKDWEKRGLEPQ